MAFERCALAGALAATLLLIASPAFAYGRLDLDANPPHTRVWVDGSPAGTVPSSIDLREGRHHVKLSAPGWRTREFGIRVKDGIQTHRSVSLARATAGKTGRVGALERGHSHRTHAEGSSSQAARPSARQAFVHEAAAPHFQKTVMHHQAAAHASAPLAAGRSHAIEAAGHGPAAVAAAPPSSEASREANPQTEAAQAPVIAPLPLPAPALDAPGLPGSVPSSVPDPAKLAPPPAAQPDVPAPVMTAPAPLATVVPGELLGLDQRTWRDLGWLLLLGSLAGGLAGWVTRSMRTPSAPPDWHARRGRRGPQAPHPEQAWASAPWDHIQAGDWEAAARSLWSLLAAQRGEAWTYYHLGLAYEELGRTMEAEAAYRAAVQADSAHSAAAFNLAVMLDAQGQAAQAAIVYRKLLEAHPDDADALFNLGHLYRELDMPRQAEVHWRAARQLTPRDRELGQDLRHLKRALRARPRRPAA